MILCQYCQQMIPKRIASSHVEVCSRVSVRKSWDWEFEGDPKEIKRLRSVFEGLEPKSLIDQLIRNSLLLKKMGW